MAKKSVKTHQLSAMRTPGFNAEASLYTSPATYRSSGGSAGTIGTVQPAVYKPHVPRCWCFTNRNGNLVCICEGIVAE